jgi:rod shape-determining protein MreD
MGMMSLLNGYFFPLTPLVFTYALTMGLFPILTWLLARTQMAFLKDV